jgi:hypothetical protein
MSEMGLHDPFEHLNKVMAKKRVGSQIGNLCRNPSLGLVTKARAYKVAGQEGSPRIMMHAPENARECEGIDLHTPKGTPKGTPTLGVGVRWTSKCSERNCKGPNQMD